MDQYQNKSDFIVKTHNLFFSEDGISKILEVSVSREELEKFLLKDLFEDTLLPPVDIQGWMLCCDLKAWILACYDGNVLGMRNFHWFSRKERTEVGDYAVPLCILAMIVRLIKMRSLDKLRVIGEIPEIRELIRISRGQVLESLRPRDVCLNDYLNDLSERA